MQDFQLFRTTTKDKGVAALKTYHTQAWLHVIHQQLIGLLLGNTVAISALTHRVLKDDIKPIHQWLHRLGLDSIATAG